MNIDFINADKWEIHKDQFKKVVGRLKENISKKEGVLNVIFVDNVFIQMLNKQYRKKDQPTDVLSFSYLNTLDYEHFHLIGEVYISVE